MAVHIGGRINKLSYKIKRTVSNLPAIKEIDDVTGTNSLILQYISRNNNIGKHVFQKDIEREFGITRSTASKVISLMESKEFVNRVCVHGDARLKKLVLTDKAKLLTDNACREIEEFDDKLLLGFNEKEINQFSDYLARINKNLEEIK